MGEEKNKKLNEIYNIYKYIYINMYNNIFLYNSTKKIAFAQSLYINIIDGAEFTKNIILPVDGATYILEHPPSIMSMDAWIQLN